MIGMMNQERPTREALEDAANAMREAHHDAMRKTIPIAKISQHPVPYWDEELSTLHNKRMRAKEECRWHKTMQGSYPKTWIGSTVLLTTLSNVELSGIL